MNRRFFLLGTLGFGWALLLGRPVPGAAAALLVESLDWVVADADLVIRGSITDFDRVRDKDEVIWATATVKVAETLKGEKKDEIKFIASHKSRFASDRLANLAKEKADILLCLVKSERYKAKAADYAGQPWALRLAEGEIDHTVVDLSGQSGSFAVALDGQVLTKKDDILKVAAVAAAAKESKQGRLRAPAAADVVRKLSDGGPVWLLVPIGKRLEETAHAWLKSKELDFRVDGVRTLRHFKSDDNIRLLKGLLDDSHGRIEGKTRTYPVRLAAFEVLKQWGIEIQRPVTEEPEGK